MNVHLIVKGWLIANGYDGLCEVDGECGCSIKDGLAPCGEMHYTCEAAYKGVCTDSGDSQNNYCMYTDAADARRAWREKMEEKSGE